METISNDTDRIHLPFSNLRAGSNFTFTAIKCFSMPLVFLCFVYLTLYLFSEQDSYHGNITQWWDITRFIALSIVIIFSTLMAIIQATKIIQDNPSRLNNFFSLIFGFAWSLITTFFLCLIFLIHECYLFWHFPPPSTHSSGFTIPSTLPTEQPTITILGFIVVFLFIFILFVPTSWFSFRYLRKFILRAR